MLIFFGTKSIISIIKNQNGLYYESYIINKRCVSKTSLPKIRLCSNPKSYITFT